MAALDTVTAALDSLSLTWRRSGANIEAQCPAHDDRQASLSITPKPGKVLIKCHAECAQADVVDKLGLKFRDLFDEDPEQTKQYVVVAEYQYTDENGELLFVAERRFPKNFRQRVPDPTAKGGWRWKLGDTRRVMYRLPEVIAAVKAQKPIYIVEGEKDADRLVSLGAVATCNPMGAGKWRKEYADTLAGAAYVLIVADADEAGRTHARQVADSLKGKVEKVGIFEPAEGKDVSDHLDAKRGLDDLVRLPDEDPNPKAKAKPVPEGAEFPPPSDPMAVARTLLPDWQHDRCLILRHWCGGWMRWEQTHWAEVDDAEIRSAIYRRLEDAFYWVSDGHGVYELTRWAPTKAKVANLVEALAACTHLHSGTNPPAWLDDPSVVRDGPQTGPLWPVSSSEVVACANGLLHIGPESLSHPRTYNGVVRGPSRTSRKLLDLTPRFFNRVAVPFDWDPAAAAPARWLEFLGELWPEDPDSVFALQEFFGYVLSGRTDLQKIMLLIGPTRSGKGTIARVLTELVGKGNVAGPTLASLGTNFGLAPLLGKPLAVVSDARLGGANVHQVVERLLSISGEDGMTVDRKYREPWTGKISARFLLLSNELPRLGDASGAIAHRFVVLAMHKSFLGKENTRLTAELTEELPGILCWALDGLDRLIEQRSFTEPASSGDSIRTLQDLISPVAAFVRDRCKVGAGLEVAVADLFTEWKDWCDLNGHKPGSVQTFGRDLRAVVPHVQQVRPRDGETRERRYVGIGLNALAQKASDDWIDEAAKRMAG